MIRTGGPGGPAFSGNMPAIGPEDPRRDKNRTARGHPGAPLANGYRNRIDDGLTAGESDGSGRAEDIVRGSVNGERNGIRTIPHRGSIRRASRVCLRQGGGNRAAHAVVAGIGARFPIVLIIVRTSGIAPGFGCRSHLRHPWPFKDLGEDRSGRKLEEQKDGDRDAHC